ncbi:MAG: hypothetical protein WDM77_09750 [Steroidobacteraceae bacterium]
MREGLVRGREVLPVPHLPKDVRNEQTYQMMDASETVRRALADAGVGTFPWLDTAEAA